MSHVIILSLRTCLQWAYSLAGQTSHNVKGEVKSGNLPIPFWFTQFERVTTCNLNEIQCLNVLFTLLVILVYCKFVYCILVSMETLTAHVNKQKKWLGCAQ